MDVQRYRPEIDGLRAIAVLPVVFYHAGFSWMPGGYVGVDVFFVISGYLITRLIRDEVVSTGRFSFSNFYLRRIRRLFPALLTVVVLSFLAAYFFAPPDMMSGFAGSVIATLLSVSNVFFWQQSGYFDAANELKPLLHTWSLSVEEQFYLIWPLLLVFTLRWRKAAAPVLLALIAAASLAASVVFLSDQASIYYLLPFRAFELAIGGLVVWAERYKPSNAWREAAVIAGLALIGWTITTYTAKTVFPSYAALPPCIGAALVIWAGRTQFAGRLLDNPAMVGIGLISYSLYLVHWPLIVFYRYRFGDFGDLSLAQQWFVCLASIVLAACVYLAIEKPLRRESPRSRLPGWRFGIAAVVAGAVAVAPAASAWASSGWIWRYPPELASLLDKRNYTVANPEWFPTSCFMDPNESPQDVNPACYETVSNGKANILLLGDSTAEHLIHGLYIRLRDKANFYLWSASSCPALPDLAISPNGNCEAALNRFFNEIFPRQKYDLVIISNLITGGFLNDLREKLPRTIAALDARKTPYVVIGQPLFYEDAPINLVGRFGRLQGLDGYMASALQKDWSCSGVVPEADKVVPAGHFFGYRDVLCRDGKPIFQSDGGLLQHDVMHLSQRGSLYFADLLIPWLESNGYLAPGEPMVSDLLAVREALEKYKLDNGSYPVSKGFDGYKSLWGDGAADYIKGLAPRYIARLPLLPDGTEPDGPTYLYRSDGRDYKLIAHRTGNCLEVQSETPALVDPYRSCWAYGFWTPGAANW